MGKPKSWPRHSGEQKITAPTGKRSLIVQFIILVVKLAELSQLQIHGK
jgi:hypothetical protein